MDLSLLTFSMLSDHRSGGLDADGLCAAAAAGGLYRLDLLEAEVTAYGEEALLAAMRTHGLRCDCLISALPFYRDPDTLPERLERALAVARRLGAGMLMVIPGQDDEAACGACTEAQLFRRAVEVFRLAVAQGAACGITVGFENTPQPWKPFCAPAECRALLDAVPGLGFILDTGNFRVADPDADELAAYALLKDRLIRIHLKDVVVGPFSDGERCRNGHFIRAVAAGAGIIPVGRLAAQALQDGYSDAFAVEYAAGPGVHGMEHARCLNVYVRNILRMAGGQPYAPPSGRIRGLDLPVSRLIFGTAIQPMLQGEDVSALLDAALASGINAFDCARGYGGAEQSLGRWIRERNNRDRVVLISKCGNVWPDGRVHIDRRVMLEECAQSLQSLGVDCIDIYLLHRDDPATPVSEYIDTLNELKAAGKIRLFGVSNWTVARIRAANDYAAAHGLAGFSVSSPNYGLARQMADPWGGSCVTIAGPEHAADRAWYAAAQMPVLAYSSLGRGVFSGRFRAFDTEGARQVLDPPARKGFLFPENMRRLHNAEQLAARDGCTVSQIALRYLFAGEMDVYAIVSISRPQRLAENVDAALCPLSPEDAAALEADSAES